MASKKKTRVDGARRRAPEAQVRRMAPGTRNDELRRTQLELERARIEGGERKRAEEALYAAAELNQHIMAGAREGIMVRDRDLRTVGVNPFMEQLTGKSAAQLIGTLPWEVFPYLKDAGVMEHLQRVLAEGSRQLKDFHFYAPETGRSVWISYTSSPLRDARGEITGVVSVINDITERKRVEARVAQLTRAQAVLAGVDRAIVRLPDRQKLLDKVCQVAVEQGGFKLAWVGMIAPDGSVQPVAQAGVTDYLRGIRVTTDDVPEGRGPTGTAIREGRPIVIEEADKDARMTPWQDRARQSGLRYVAAFPIRVAGKVAGSFQVYAPQSHFFDENEMALMTQVSEDVSFALTAISELAARKQAEDALHDANELNQQMIAGAKDGIVVYNREPACLIWNPFMEKLMGKSAADVLGKRPLEVFPFLQADGVMKRLERILSGETCAEEEILLRPPRGGRPIWVSDSSSALRNAKGEITGGMSIIRDISERKEAEERIAKLSRVQTIMASIDRAIVHIPDRQKLLDEICRVAVEVGGFKLAWVGMVAPDGAVRPVAKAGATAYLDSGRAVIQNVPEGRGPTGTAIREDRPVVVEEADQDPRLAPWHDHLRRFGMRYIAAFPIRIGGKVAGSFQVYATQANFFNEAEVSLLTQVSDDVSFALTAISDLAARKHAEESLRRSEHNLTSFFNQAPIGLIWLSSRGTILRANQAQMDLLGYPAAEYLGHSFTEFCADPSEGRQLLELLAAKKTVRNFQMTRRCKDGAIRHALVDAVSFSSEGEFFYSSVFLRDITDRVKLEREILDASERESQRIAQDLHDGLGQLLAGTAHLAGLLHKDLAAKSRPEARQSERISKLMYEAIAQARSLSRGLHPVEPESNGLMVALESLAARTKSLFQITCRFTCKRPVLIADNTVATHLYRIAQEAVSNAVRHGKPARIEISLTRTPDRIALAVKDNGAGMPARRQDNSGIGLRIMRYRAGMMNGALAIENREGGGTAVLCTVPSPGPRRQEARPQSHTEGVII